MTSRTGAPSFAWSKAMPTAESCRRRQRLGMSLTLLGLGGLAFGAFVLKSQRFVRWSAPLSLGLGGMVMLAGSYTYYRWHPQTIISEHNEAPLAHSHGGSLWEKTLGPIRESDEQHHLQAERLVQLAQAKPPSTPDDWDKLMHAVSRLDPSWQCTRALAQLRWNPFEIGPEFLVYTQRVDTTREATIPEDQEDHLADLFQMAFPTYEDQRTALLQVIMRRRPSLLPKKSEEAYPLREAPLDRAWAVHMWGCLCQRAITDLDRQRADKELRALQKLSMLPNVWPENSPIHNMMVQSCIEGHLQALQSHGDAVLFSEVLELLTGLLPSSEGGIRTLKNPRKQTAVAPKGAT